MGGGWCRCRRGRQVFDHRLQELFEDGLPGCGVGAGWDVDLEIADVGPAVKDVSQSLPGGLGPSAESQDDPIFVVADRLDAGLAGQEPDSGGET